MVSEVLNLKVSSLKRLANGGKVKAFCDLVFGDLFLIRGFRVVEGEKGTFVGMPQQRSNQGKWFSIFTPSTNEIREYISEVILQAYESRDQETKEE